MSTTSEPHSRAASARRPSSAAPAASTPAGIGNSVSRWVDQIAGAGVTDRELLHRYTEHADQNAFEVLVGFVALLVLDSGQQASSNVANVLPVNQRAAFVKQATELGLLK